MMDELIDRVTAKTGLNPDQAKAAVESVIGYLTETDAQKAGNRAAKQSVVGKKKSAEKQ